MGKIVRLSESQFNHVLKYKIEEQSDIDEYGQKGLWKSEWNEEDQILAMFNALYGIEDLGISKEELMSDVIGSSLGSLAKQTANFKFLNGEPGLDRPHTIQSPVFEKYKNIPKTEFKALCLDIIRKRRENPETSVVNKKLGNKIGLKRDEIQKSREDALRSKGIDPSRVKLISSKSKNEPEPEDSEPEPSVLPQQTAKDEIRDFLQAMYDRARNVTSKEDARGLADDIKFIMDYIDSELPDKSIVAEITNLLKTKNQLFESEAVKNIKRITDINNKINL